MTDEQFRDLRKQSATHFRNDSGERAHNRKAGDGKRRAAHRQMRRRASARLRQYAA